MEFSDIDLIRFVKSFTRACLENKKMHEKSLFGRIQFLYYRPKELKPKTYNKLNLDSNKECFIAVCCYTDGKTIFSTDKTDQKSICDMYETISNHLEKL